MSARACLICIILALCCGAVFADAGSHIKWAPNIESGQRAATEFRVPLLIHFTGEGCLPCRTLEKNVLSNPEVIDVMNKYFICVQINGTRDRETMAEYSVHSYPTDVFIGSDGKPLHQSVSPQDVRNYLGMLERVAVQNRDQNALFAGKNPANTSVSAQQPNLVNTNPAVQSSLPPPGQLASTNGETPGFYLANGGAAAQQKLTQGSASSAQVQSGPLLAHQQPHAIIGSTIPTGTQVGLSPQNPSQNKDPLNLPRIQHATPSQLSSYAQLSSVDPALNHGPQPPMAQTQPNEQIWNNNYSPSPTTTDNPHFQQVSTSLEQSLGSFANQAALHESPTGLPNLIGDVSASPTTASPVPNVNNTSTISSLSTAQPEFSVPPQLDGYCPVSLRFKQWKRGQQLLAVKHRGQLYWLLDEASLEAFLQAPDNYVPVLLGNDPMILLDEGRMVPGSTQYGLFEDKIGPIFFATAESKIRFLANFNTNMQALEAILQRAATVR